MNVSKIHRLNGRLLLTTQDGTVKKALVGLAIKKALLGMGQSALDNVSKKLEEEYGCYVFDCYEKPEILHNVLDEMYGKSSKSIMFSIRKNLEEFSDQEPINKFLTVISA